MSNENSTSDIERNLEKVLEARDEMLIERLREQGLLKEPEEPGKVKKVFAGAINLFTSQIDKLEERGEKHLDKSANKTAAEKKFERELANLTKDLRKKHNL